MDIQPFAKKDYKTLDICANGQLKLTGLDTSSLAPLWGSIFIFGTACQIYCYGRYCVTQSVSPKVPENPSGPLVDNFIVLPCVACGVVCVKLLPGVDGWNSLDDPRVIGPSRCQRCLSRLVPRSAETPLVKGTVIFTWKIFGSWRHCLNTRRFQ